MPPTDAALPVPGAQQSARLAAVWKVRDVRYSSQRLFFPQCSPRQAGCLLFCGEVEMKIVCNRVKALSMCLLEQLLLAAYELHFPLPGMSHFTSLFPHGVGDLGRRGARWAGSISDWQSKLRLLSLWCEVA